MGLSLQGSLALRRKLGPVGGPPGGGGQVYDPSSVAIFNSFTIPPTRSRKILINNLVVGLKNSGDWQQFDILHVTAAADSQAASINWKNPASLALTTVSGPVFTADRGFKGDGVAAGLACTYNPTTFSSPTYTQNAATTGIWLLQPSTINSAVEMLLGASRIQRQSTGVNYQGRINDATSINGTAPAAGHWAIQRTGATARSMWKNGAVTISDAQASTTIPSASETLLNAMGSNFSDAQFSIQYAGGIPNIAAINALFTSYLQGVGAI